MIDRSTDIRAALKSRQRGFFTMPGGMGAGRPAGGGGGAGYASQILALSPIFYHRLNEVGGTNFADATGNGWTGTERATVTKNQSPLISGNTASIVNSGGGGIDTAQLFSGGNYSGSWSMTCIFKKNATPTDNEIGIFAGKGRDGYGGGWGFMAAISPTLQIRSLAVIGGSVIDCSSSASAYSIGTVCIYVTTFSSANGLRVYANGNLLQTAAASGNLRGSTWGARLGTGNNYAISSGFYFSDHAWFSYELSAAQISALYAARNT